MLTGHGIQSNLTELIDSLAKAPNTLSPYAIHALADYLLQLLDEQILEAREYSLLSEHLYDAFMDVANLNSNQPEKTNGHQINIVEAVELVNKISRVKTADQEIECECDIGIFIDRLHREVKLGLTEGIELDFYRRWMSHALFNRPNLEAA